MDKDMSEPVKTKGPPAPPDPAPLKRGQSAQVQRDTRSKAALKANMARRKAQGRARETEAANQGGPEDE
jgi:hypothetical protein